MNPQQSPGPNENPTSFVHPDPEAQKAIERRAEELLSEVDGEDSLAQDEENEEEEYEFWTLTVGQRAGDEHEICANFFPRCEWEGALEEADGNQPDGFVILTAPGGDYVQALAVPEGFVLEYREIWPGEESPGFRHYRARRPDEEEQPPRDDDAVETWAMTLETVAECFECFSEYPDETPESAEMEWRDVTERFAPAPG